MTGVVVWITGIPAAGKTTLATALDHELVAGGHAARCIDGDQLRATVSRDLDFGRDARGENARRATTLALQAADAGDIAIVSLVSPYRTDRDAARANVNAHGARFIEVFLDTPLVECRRRDPKGLYAAAAEGRITALTGWDAPYEAPDAPEVHLAPPPGGRAPALTDSVARVLAAVGEIDAAT